MTTAKPTTTAKPATKPRAKVAAKPAAKPVVKKTAPATKPPVPPVIASVSAAPERVVKLQATSTLKLKDLIDRVTAATGGKKKGVKELVEATLAELGAALSKGEDLNLPPLGKAHVNRQKAKGAGELLIVKLNRAPARAKPEKAAKQGIAKDED